MSDAAHPSSVVNGRVMEHPILPLFTQRWSPRAFTDEAIDEATLLGLLEAARWAPSSMNNQPWRFVYARRPSPEWSAIHATLVPFNQEWTARASALVVVLSKTVMVSPYSGEAQPNRSHSFDTGAAWMSVALQATAAGFSTHAMTGVDFEALRTAIGAPADFTLDAVFAIGRQGPVDVLPEAMQSREVPSARKPLRAIATAGRFQFAE